MEALTIVGNICFIVACVLFVGGVQNFIVHLVSFSVSGLNKVELVWTASMVPYTFAYIMTFLFIW